MSFGKRGGTLCVNGISWRSSKPNFIELSSSLWSSGHDVLRRIRGVWSSRIASDRLLYPLTCLALGLFLGGSVGAAVAPQLLQAGEDSGVYDVIRQSAAMRAAAQRPAPQARLQALRIRLGAHVMRARLAPARHSVLRGRASAESEAPSPCPGCGEAHYASPIEAILNDQTLRAGDTVMLKAGAKVFRGGGKHMPYTPDDFVDFRSTSLLTKLERRQIDAALGLTQKSQALQAFESKTFDAKIFDAKIHATQASLGERKAQGLPLALPASGAVVQVLR
ncbi:hypothetical protein SAMN05444161_1098 [Rhizobiales bacterium GAS191]|nr:hypothetical protein SAMN05444161_1098 [Rhizobiales bacterium GAS191]